MALLVVFASGHETYYTVEGYATSMLQTRVPGGRRRPTCTWPVLAWLLALLLLAVVSVLPTAAVAADAAFLLGAPGLSSSRSTSSPEMIQGPSRPCWSFVHHASAGAADTELLLPKQLEESDLSTSTATTTSTTTSITKATKKLYLLSLQWSDDDQPQGLHHRHDRRHRRFSPTVRRLWRWKDAVLGDGLDFFVPKPRTVAALQSYLRLASGTTSTTTGGGAGGDDATTTTGATSYTIRECVVLSNCARFEILLVVTDGHHHRDRQQQQEEEANDDDDDDAVVVDVSSRLVAQVESYYRRKRGPFHIQMPFDWPGDIDMDAYHREGFLAAQKEDNDDDDPLQQRQRQRREEEAVRDLARHWTVLRGPEEIAEHLSLVAAGLAPRPRRPDRPVAFRPFSSRDAHVLLQLKRTLDVAGTAAASSSASARRRQRRRRRQNTTTATTTTILLPTLLRCALRAGKAARNPDVVPELVELRRRYGATGNHRKYDAVPPAEISRRVAAAARVKAVDPIVRECVAQLRSADFADQIRSFRERAAALGLDDAERAFVQKRIHEPTLQLRQGDVTVDVSGILERLSNELEAGRQREAARDAKVT